jgi:hypothetical protein
MIFFRVPKYVPEPDTDWESSGSSASLNNDNENAYYSLLDKNDEGPMF